MGFGCSVHFEQMQNQMQQQVKTDSAFTTDENSVPQFSASAKDKVGKERLMTQYGATLATASGRVKVRPLV